MDKKGILIAIVAIIVLLVINYFIFFKAETCETAFCFEEKADKECSKAELRLQERNGTISFYEILGKSGQNCEVKLTMEKAPILSAETRNLFEGKSMTCTIPRDEFARMTVRDVGGNLDYCTGPLKEAMYGTLIKKLYGLVIRDMTSVLREVEKQL